MRRAIFFVATLLSSSNALAVDGVIEINQTAALAGGISPCDAPGFPVSICSSGSYRLTSNLQFSSGRGIEVSASDVTLDLNGMAVRGTSICLVGANQWVTSCSGSGSSDDWGIGVNNFAGVARLRIENGTVQGAGGPCIFVGAASPATLEGLVLSNCLQGAVVGWRSIVKDVKAVGNRYEGIFAQAFLFAVQGTTLMENVVATNNGGPGIDMPLGVDLRGVVGSWNALDGISVGPGSLLADFVASFNGSNGVNLGDGSLARSGVVRNNGLAASTSCGVQGQGGAGYREVVITAAAGGNPTIACGPGLVNLGDNSCQGGSCPP